MDTEERTVVEIDGKQYVFTEHDLYTGDATNPGFVAMFTPIPKETSATMTTDTSTPDLKQIEEELTDIEDFLDEHADRVRQMQQDAEDLANGTDRERFAAFLRLRRFGRRAAESARQTAGGVKRDWKATLNALGLRKTLTAFAGHYVGRVHAIVQKYLGVGNVASLLIATARGRRILNAAAAPLRFLQRLTAKALSKVPGGQKVNDKAFDAREWAEKKAEAWGVKGYFDVDGNAMARWRLAAVLGIALKIARRIGGRKMAVAVIVAHLILTDRKTGPKVRAFFIGLAVGIWVAIKGVKVQTPTVDETVAAGKQAAEEADTRTSSQRRRDEKAAKRAAAKAQAEAEASYEPNPEATEPGAPAA